MHPTCGGFQKLGACFWKPYSKDFTYIYIYICIYAGVYSEVPLFIETAICAALSNGLGRKESEGAPNSAYAPVCTPSIPFNNP